MPRLEDNSPNEPRPTSSVPVVIPKEQQELFRDVLSLLERSHLPYAVAGAFALRQHTGINRFTKDLDIFLAPDNAARALDLLCENDFQCEVRDKVWLAKAHRDGFFVDIITGMSNGILTVDNSWIERATPARIFWIRTCVLAPEELLASKLFVVRRERFDGADIAHIIYATKGQLDWNRVLELAGKHWEILLWALIFFHYAYPANSNYVPRDLWEDLLARFATEIRKPNPKAKFRGSLIDDAMFNIDFEEWGLENLIRESRAGCMKIGPLHHRRSA